MNPGLDDVVAAETVLSHVDGAAGRLIVRGFDLEEISGRSFEAVVALLWEGLAPRQESEATLRVALGDARVTAFERAAPLLAATDRLSSIEGLRLLLSALADAEDIPHHVLAVAALPVFVAALAQDARLMGFGHRVYRVRDPRADVLKAAVVTLRGGENRIRFAEAVEAEALAILARHRPGRRIDTNVEFYTALLLEALAIPRDSFTNVFAVGRVAGWTGHILEQNRIDRLIRPQSRYVGPQPRQPLAA